MKTLDLYATPTYELMNKLPIIMKGNMTDRQFLELEIKNWLTSETRKRQITADEYYEGFQKILSKKRMVFIGDGKTMEDKNLPNNIIVDNQHRKAVDVKKNYSFGKPFTFNCENEQYGKILDVYFSKKVLRKVKKLGEEAINCGVAWLYIYYDADGKLSEKVLKASSVLPFWADEEHSELDAFIHYYDVFSYDIDGKEKIIHKVDAYHGGGIDHFVYEDGHLKDDEKHTDYAVIKDAKGNDVGYNWQRCPLICFKSNDRETPLVMRTKALQDSLNFLISIFADNMSEDINSTILVIENAGDTNLGEFRRNLMNYKAVKVDSYEGADGGIDTLKIEVNAENYKTVIALLRKAIMDNARAFDAKDDRLGTNPNQMNLKSLYFDMDLDANDIETEFAAAFEEWFYFINLDLANSGQGDFTGESVDVIFNRDTIVNESEVINDCKNSVGIISDETIIKNHPYVIDAVEEMKRIEKEKKEAQKETDVYKDAFDRQMNAEAEGGEEDAEE